LASNSPAAANKAAGAAARLHLEHGQTKARAEGGQEMHAGELVSLAAAQALAVNGHRAWLMRFGRRLRLRDPTRERRLEGRYVQVLEDVVERGHTRRLLAPKAQRPHQLTAVVTAPLRRGVQTARPAEHRAGRQ
jgi:hypothetical protein